MPLEPFRLAESAAKRDFEPDFYAHLDRLAAIEFGRTEGYGRRFTFSLAKYISLQQAAFEEGARVEGQPRSDVDWLSIDERTDQFRQRLKQSVTHANKDVAPIIEFSAEVYENWLTYEAMYPAALSNPWEPATQALSKGRLFLVTAKPEQLLELTGSKSRAAELRDVKRLGVVVKAERLSGFVIDDRHALQRMILGFLKTHANGHENPISLEDIRTHLREKGAADMSVSSIQVVLTVPLKKSGAIGSSSKGYFHISNHEDLIVSYCFHHSKVSSISRIMRRYERRGREEFDGLDIQDECSGLMLNRLG